MTFFHSFSAIDMTFNHEYLINYSRQKVPFEV